MIKLTHDPRHVVHLPYGNFTAREEIYCWFMAATNRARFSCRMAYGRDCRRAGNRTPTPKHAMRIDDLRSQHEAGAIDLDGGKAVWKAYPWALEVGFPDMIFKPLPRDYGYDKIQG